MKIFISVLQPDGKKFVFQLGPTAVTIGRSANCQVTLNDPKCSGAHCTIMYTGDGVAVEDCNSKNGLFLNTIQIMQQRIYIGDIVRMGDSQLFIEEHRLDEDAKKLLKPSKSMRHAGEITIEIDKGSIKKR